MSYYRSATYSENKRYCYKIESYAGFDAASQEDGMPLNYAPYGYNIRIANGCLTEGYGVGYATVGGHRIPSTLSGGIGIKKLFLYKRFDRTSGVRDDRLIVLGDTGEIYQANLSTASSFASVDAQVSSMNVTFLNCEYQNKDYLFISSDRGEIILYDGTTATTYTDKPYLTDACVYNNRIYAVAGSGKNALLYSGVWNPTSWGDNDKISFPDEGGKLLKVLVLKDNLFIFRERSVYRFTAYQGSSGYSLTQVLVTETPIYANSATVCGSMLYVATGEGFFRYNGSTFERCWQSLFPLIDDLSGCAAKSFRGRYFLACRMKTEGETVGDEGRLVQNNAVLGIVDEKDVSVLRGTDVCGFVPVTYNDDSALFLQFTYGYKMYDIGMLDESGKLFSASLQKKWRSPVSCLSHLQYGKRLRKIFLRPSGNVTLQVILDDTYEFQLGNGGSVQAVFVNKKADAVGLVLTSTAASFRPGSIEMEFELPERSIYDK